MTPRFVKQLKDPTKWEAFQEELKSKDINIVSSKKYGNVMVMGKLMTEYDLKLDDGKEMSVKVSGGEVKVIIYDDRVILDPSHPKSLKKVAREIAKISLAQRVKGAKKIDIKAQKEVSKIIPTQIKELENEIEELKKELK